MTPDVPLIRKLMAKQDLARDESAALLGSLLRTDEEGWRFLAFSVASQTKGETVDEMLGMFDALRQATAPYGLSLPSEMLDVASAGGTGIRKLNISTLNALVIGEPSMPVAKQSFWGITSVTGSADVLREVGLFVPTVQLGEAFSTVGVAFYSPLFLSQELANLVHFGQVLGAKSIGVNTPFNLVAPIFTPLPLTCRMFGVNNPRQVDLILDIFRGLGLRAALALHGMDGLDEVSLCAPTRLRGFRDGEEIDCVFEPEQAGLRTVPREAVQPQDARSNAHRRRDRDRPQARPRGGQQRRRPVAHRPCRQHRGGRPDRHRPAREWRGRREADPAGGARRRSGDPASGPLRASHSHPGIRTGVRESMDLRREILRNVMQTAIVKKFQAAHSPIRACIR